MPIKHFYRARSLDICSIIGRIGGRRSYRAAMLYGTTMDSMLNIVYARARSQTRFGVADYNVQSKTFVSREYIICMYVYIHS